MCCLVQLHKSPKGVSNPDMTDYSVPARIVTTYSPGSPDEKHQRVHIINTPARRSSTYNSSTTAVNSSPASSGYHRVQRRNTMASGGPARASYVSSRGAAYHRHTEKFFYGRDSGAPLLLSAQYVDSEGYSGDDKSSSSDAHSLRSTTSTTKSVNSNSSVVVRN